MRARWTILVFVLLHIGIFLGLFAELGRQFDFCPGVLEHWFALKMLDGEIPYLDFDAEYPPLALLSFLLPGIFFRSETAYAWAFEGQMLLLDLAILLLVASLASRLRISVWGALGIYTLAILAAGPIVISRYDLLPAMTVIAALYAFITRRDKLAWAILALGAAAKFYPAIIVPLFALYCLRHREYQRLLQGGGAFVAVLLAILLPCVLLSPEGFWYALSYHAERGLHSESSYASVLLIGQVLGLTHVEGTFSFGSWNLSAPLADSLSGISTYIALALLATVYGLYARSLWRGTDPTKREIAPLDRERAGQAINYSLLAVLVFLLTSKVFSPQFLVWLCPLLPLAGGRFRHALWGLSLVVGGLSQYIFPHHYLDFELGKPYLIAMLAFRNLLLAVMALLLVEWRLGPVTRTVASSSPRST